MPPLPPEQTPEQTQSQSSRRQRPPLVDLLLRPQRYFERLAALPEHPYRFVPYFVPALLYLGVYGFLAALPVERAMQGFPFRGPGPLTLLPVLALLSVLFWFIQGKIGQRLMGRQARPLEVFGLMLGVLWIPAALLLPLLFVGTDLPLNPPDVTGLQGEELKRALSSYRLELTRALNASPVRQGLRLSNLVLAAWGAYLCFVGFRVLTGNQKKALLGAALFALPQMFSALS